MKRIRILGLLTVLVLVVGMSGVAYAAPSEPETITSISFSPSSGYVGGSTTLTIQFNVSDPATNDYNAFCIYFKEGDGWGANFPVSATSLLGDSYTKTDEGCTNVTNYDDVLYYVEPVNEFADGGDILSLAVTVPSITAGIKAFAVRQRSGSSSPGTLINTANPSFEVLAAPSTVYAGSDCTGYTPCYTTLANAYTAVATGGTIRVVNAMSAENLAIAKNLTLLDYTGSGSITGAAGAEVLHVTAGTVVIQDLTISIGSAVDLIDVDGGTVTVKGCTLSGGTNAFDQSAGTLYGYANNITGFTQVALAGTTSLKHNWWGSYTSQPTNLPGVDWGARLGADISSWGEGTLGSASISGGTGTGVIVSHGRGSANAPFDQATTDDGNTQCSDYYDFFVAPGGSGNWDITMPIDDGSGCDNAYNNRKLFLFDAATPACLTSGTPDVACWDIVSPVVQLGGSPRRLRYTATTAQLGGTPIVSGNQAGNDPNAITLTNITARSPNLWLPVGLVVAAAAVALGALVTLRRRQ